MESQHRLFSGVAMRKFFLGAACFIALAPVAEGTTTPSPTQAQGQLTNGPPDLMPSEVTASVSAIKHGQSVTVGWVMANNGDQRGWRDS